MSGLLSLLLALFLGGVDAESDFDLDVSQFLGGSDIDQERAHVHVGEFWLFLIRRMLIALLLLFVVLAGLSFGTAP